MFSALVAPIFSLTIFFSRKSNYSTCNSDLDSRGTVARWIACFARIVAAVITPNVANDKST